MRSAIATSPLLSAPCPSAKLRVGVVGVGYLGKFHAEKYARMENAELVGVADTNQQQAESIAEKFGTKAYYRHQELIGKVDAVSVAVPTHDHFAVSKDFLENGVDVLIEKPMTSTLEEADELIRIAESKGLIVQVGHLERFNPAVIALQGIIKKPMFIESHRLSVYKGRSMDVSVVLDLMIHDIDIISNFVKSDVRKIHASGVSVISGLLDIANARLEFESGCVANVTASRISMKNERKIRLFQKDAYISVDFASREITAVRMREDSESGMQHIENNTPNLELIPGMEISQTCFADGDALEQELKSFVNAVRKRETSEVTGQMGRDALKIALSIMEQIRRKND
ncbi:MAG: UDP-N-acetyl-D-glucosamine dehydrogenase [Desulfobacteraceae bacterium IS3]|nr:MAG: UDP-N-acetyl-D-glucosamine dehydrogenase [Desulfobacteraceae bacterium IS3]